MIEREQSRKQEKKRKILLKVNKEKVKKFDLQNSPKKYRGFKNKYCYQSNIHNVIYKDGNFENIRYQASNITKCNFKSTKLNGVDFCNCNLKGTTFKGSILNDVVFINCNLKKVDFTNVKFHNTYFIMTNTDVCVNLDLNTNYKILKHYPSDIKLDSMGLDAIFKLGNIKKIYKNHVLHVSTKKINMWTLKILFDMYGPDVNRALFALIKRNDKRYFFTISSYMRFIESYLNL